MTKQHKMSWETKKCINCGVEAKKVFDGQQCGEEEFQYKMPVVANITIKMPDRKITCSHKMVTSSGTCLDCHAVDLINKAVVNVW